MSPRVPEAYLEARRKEILDAAYKCFLEKGFQNTTMQDIYQASNLSPGAVYNYFSSKEDIVLAAVREQQDWSLSTLASIISENPNESIVKYLQYWFSVIKQKNLSKNISVQLEYYAEATRNDKIREAMLKSMDATHAKLIDLIKKNQRAGIFNAKLDPLEIARAMVGMVFVAGIHKTLNPEVNVEAYRQVCEAMINGVFYSLPPKSQRGRQSGVKKQENKDRSG